MEREGGREGGGWEGWRDGVEREGGGGKELKREGGGGRDEKGGMRREGVGGRRKEGQ